MESFKMILNIIKSKINTFCGNYYIPEKWNFFGYQNYKIEAERPGEINVNPYDFFYDCFEKIPVDENTEERPDIGGQITGNIIYSILPRSFTAWPHRGKSEIYAGTFLKTLIMLPMLKKFGVSILYLLPIFACGGRYKKGSLGSPYAIKDIYRLDSGLHDPLLGDFSQDLLKVEFKAFVEACHTLGIKVIVDFAFRTVSRDNVLISKHPDWFYWIKSEYNGNFKPPMLGDGEKSCSLNENTMKRLYKSPGIKQYLSQFTLPPNRIDKAEWDKITNRTENINSAVEQIFGVTTAPGFSDVINDSQPAWTDVTYLKYYFDCPAETQKYIPENQPPFIMQDGATLNKFYGKVKNEELWDYIIGVLPFYRENYGIDGARIDMAHALPAELNTLMIKKIKESDSGFILWSEEFDAAKGAQARQDGFDFISGFTYMNYKKIYKSSFNSDILQNCLLKSELPVVASLETPDTPRSALIYKNTALLKLALIINNFMPNSVPMINSGQELMEIQPMNLGLDNNENGRFVLPKSDPMYGRLAFFDTYCLHWLNSEEDVIKVLCDTIDIRKKYLHLIMAKDNFIIRPELFHNKKLTVLCYYDKKSGDGLIVAANRSENSHALFDLKKHLPIRLADRSRATIIYNKSKKCKIVAIVKKGFYINPLDAVIIELKNK